MPYDTRTVEASSYDQRIRRISLAVGLIVIALSCFRLAHVQLLWADEDYHLAAAINILHGKVPYRDFWYDKPPLAAIYYLCIGGRSGWALRLLDAAYIVACCAVAYRFAQSWWGRAEGLIAALLLAFFTTFYLPSAVIAFAADAVMLLPHLLAVYCAFRGRPALAGALAGIAFLANPKGLFVLFSCGLFLFPRFLPLLASFLLTSGAGLAVLSWEGAWPAYWEQVWQWGLVYAKGSPVVHPFTNGVSRVGNWAGFHALPVLATFYSLEKLQGRDRWRLGGWLLLSFVAVALGSRFAPHYFLQLLPVIVIAGSKGLTLAFNQHRRLVLIVATALLLVPAIRFGPRYLSLLWDPSAPRWNDVAMDRDSKAVVHQITAKAHSGDTLFVWGYRPDIYVYSRMVSDSRFWDSQPLTGVPADRHLSATTAIYGGPAKQNREQLLRSQPTWIVDGLGVINPALRIDAYNDLKAWLANYEIVGRTPLSVIYRRKGGGLN